MGNQENQANGNTSQTPPVNTLKLWEKRVAGTLLIFFTLLPAVLIIGYWPDRLPGAKDAIKPLYEANLFHTRLIGICDDISYAEAAAMFIDSVQLAGNTKGVKKDSATIDTTADTSDTGSGQEQPDTGNGSKESASGGSTAPPEISSVVKTSEGDLVVNGNCLTVEDESRYIHINTLLLLLVALAGFLGNMIHIATSLTTFLATGKFDRNWMLWYYVRPFTASALAMGIYFVFRGGFMNMSGDIVNINLYGVMTISLLAGLFTDRATQKLKEVFDVIFKPKDERPGKLEGDFKITGVTPVEIEAGKENMITIKGEHLGSKKFTVTINDEPVPVADFDENEAHVKYAIPATQQGKTEFKLQVKDESGISFPFSLKLKPADEGGQEDAEDDDNGKE